jgi:hypothetical protein
MNSEWLVALMVLAAVAGSTGEKAVPVTLEPLAGGLKRIMLSPRTAERFGIEVRKVAILPVVHKQVASGLAIPALHETKHVERELGLNKRVRVELQLSGSEKPQKVVPYSAVYYDAKGASWLYVNSRPLVFERQRISVERVIGDLAVLAEGPAPGTAVVTAGAARLYGAEIFGR